MKTSQLNYLILLPLLLATSCSSTVSQENFWNLVEDTDKFLYEYAELNIKSKTIREDNINKEGCYSLKESCVLRTNNRSDNIATFWMDLKLVKGEPGSVAKEYIKNPGAFDFYAKDLYSNTGFYNDYPNYHISYYKNPLKIVYGYIEDTYYDSSFNGEYFYSEEMVATFTKLKYTSKITCVRKTSMKGYFNYSSEDKKDYQETYTYEINFKYYN